MNDVKVISFPRCGRTWFRTILHRYCCPDKELPDFVTEPGWVTFYHDYTELAKRGETCKIEIDPKSHYVVLSRDPFRSIESYRAIPKDAHARQWFDSQEDMFKTWEESYRKWILPLDFPAPRLILCYEDLMMYPAACLVRFLLFAGVKDVHYDLVEKAIKEFPPCPRPHGEVMLCQTDTPW